ncbi:MAG: AAA family ATPase [Nitrospira sp.]|nr:AAA family ATPase [Nitrospira sp.]
MKLIRLLLQAFGPFTNKTVDFSTGPTDLHLLYGPNEAGKSSALRAMMDLRFGIPVRSPDHFLHAPGDLRIAGIFMDQAGERIGLVRRKGRGATLARLDIVTEQPDPALTVESQQERELTGGLDRAEFEAMFGLTHVRLREGGKVLLSGEGNLGSALFEASAGTSGIAALLAALEIDAKKLYSPHGRAQNAVINEARRRLDDQRQAWRQAQTKPADWQTLNRAHETAGATLDDVTKKLEALRRRENELTELRTVEPLLREHDRVATVVHELAGVPDLAENSREERLAATQAVTHAQQALSETEVELEGCALALKALVLEPLLLAHAEAIERLLSGVAAAAHHRIELQQQHSVMAKLENDLAMIAARLAPGRALRDLLPAVPSDADRVTLDAHLAQVSLLSERLDGYRQRAEALDQTLHAESDQLPAMTDPITRQALAATIRTAQSLGDVARQRAELDRQIREQERSLELALSDLSIATEPDLRRTRHILDSQIAQTRQELTDVDEQLKKMRDELQLVGRDLDGQRLRQRQLAAEGEVITAETLRLARARRDEGWRLIRRGYIDRHQDEKDLARSFDAARTLPEAFEAAGQEADRQADLLRADARRAAVVEECSVRMEQMEARRVEIKREMTALSARRGDLLAAWGQRLSQAGLPNLDPEPLREWQGKRHEALQLAERVETLRADRDRLLAEAREAASRITEAMRAVGHLVTDTNAGDAHALPSIIEQGVGWEKQVVESEADRSAKTKAARNQRVEREKVGSLLADSEAELQRHLSALQEWQARLFLPSGTAPEAIEARLDELDGVARQAATLSDAQQRKAQVQAILDDLDTQSNQVAALLGEPVPLAVEDFADRLQTRLAASRVRDQERKTLLRDQVKAREKARQAELERAAQQAVHARLCAVAAVETIDSLPELEEAAARKREARKTLSELRRRIAEASSRPEAELRQRLAGRDSLAIESERGYCAEEMRVREQEQASARQVEEQARRALEGIDSSDRAAMAREAMESAAARYRAAIRPWARLRLARALLQEALNRFRERAQAPMVTAASRYFSLITGNAYERLITDETEEKAVLCAQRAGGSRIKIEEMSEGTADQLYLALRLAALELRRSSHPQMPLVLDDALITSDDERAANILLALARFAEGEQVMIFTHHRHLIDVARATLGEHAFAAHTL